MNNNQMNFDSMTGQPINQNTNTENIQTISNINSAPVLEPTQQSIPIVTQPEIMNQTINTINTQQQLQSIPTVEQSKQEFINNAQNLNTEKKIEKKEGVNYIFIIILFVIIFAAIFFLFPLLLNYI